MIDNSKVAVDIVKDTTACADELAAAASSLVALTAYDPYSQSPYFDEIQTAISQLSNGTAQLPSFSSLVTKVADRLSNDAE